MPQEMTTTGEIPPQPQTVPEKIAEDYQALVAVIPPDDSQAQRALARLTQVASDEYDAAKVLGAEAEDMRRRAFVSIKTNLPNFNALQYKHDREAAAEERRQLSARYRTERRRTSQVLGWMTVAVDLDYFKEVNDTFGHHQGDRLLLLGGYALQSCVRSNDELYHLSGDEFLAFLPHTAPKTPEEVATDMKDSFKQHLQRQIEGDPATVPEDVTVTDVDKRSLRIIDATFGAHWSYGSYINRMAMHKIADLALIKAKEARPHTRSRR